MFNRTEMKKADGRKWRQTGTSGCVWETDVVTMEDILKESVGNELSIGNEDEHKMR